MIYKQWRTFWTLQQENTNSGVPSEPYSKRIQNDYIQLQHKSNGNVGEPHTEGKNCDKQQYCWTGNRF